jgi:hypothetical protein
MKSSMIFLFNFFGPVLKPVKTSPSYQSVTEQIEKSTIASKIIC